MEQKVSSEHVTGLRAWAVILITLFYVNSGYWTHAYMGIDIFLVVTGYLIFSNRRNFKGNETIRDSFFFLLRRLHKIIPPMSVVIFVTVLIGAFVLWWEDEWFLSKLGFDACLAKANILLGKDETENYFASEIARYMPLLHLWYISAIVQIYVLFGIGNQLMQKMTKPKIIVILSLVAAASLTWRYSFSIHEWLAKGGITLWEQSSDVSYFHTFPRLWEVLAGGLVIVLPSLSGRKFLASLASGVGLVLILASALAGNLPGTESLVDIPGPIFVVIGCVLTIRYLPASIFTKILTNKVMRWIGGISFSVFLVSKPIIVFGNIWAYGHPSFMVQLLILGCIVLLGWLLRKYVEKRDVLPEILMSLWGAAFVLCGLGSLTEGFKSYVPSVTLETHSHEWRLCRDDRLLSNWNPVLQLSTDVFRFTNSKPPKSAARMTPLLTLGDQNRRATIALIGDSHAAAHYAGISNFCNKEDLGGVYVASNILTFHNWKWQDNIAKEQALLDWLAAQKRITHVIISQRWTEKYREIATLSGNPHAGPARFSSDLRAFLKELQSRGKKVILIASGPEFNMEPLQHYCKMLGLRGMHISDIAPVCTREEHAERNKDVRPILDQMEKEKLCTIIDPQDALEAGYDFHAAADNTLLMYDHHHMYSEHSIYLIERLVPQLRQALDIVSDKPFDFSRKTTPQSELKK